MQSSRVASQHKHPQANQRRASQRKRRRVLAEQQHCRQGRQHRADAARQRVHQRQVADAIALAEQQEVRQM